MYQLKKFLQEKVEALGKIVRDLSGSGKPENELEDIDGFVHFIIEQLP